MKKTLKINFMGKLLATFALLLVFVIACMPLVAAAADGSKASGDIGFYVSAKIPENQKDDKLTYFDLGMQPGQQQQLEVDVVNESGTAIVVDVQAISASTNRNGVIDYKTPNVRDESLKIPFSDISTLSANSLQVPANSTKTVTVTLQMPGQSYDGVILGGLVFTKQVNGNGTTQQNGLSIQNVYSYVVGVKLSETDVEVLPSFELVEVEGDLVAYEPATIHYIRNKEAVIVKNLNLSVSIYKEGVTEPVVQVENSGLEMAPNSVMPLAVTMPGGKLDAGNYNSFVRVEHNGTVWEFEKRFTIDKPRADEINDGAIPGAQGTATSHPLWVFIAAGILLLILLLIIIFLLILLFKRRKKEDEERAEARETYKKTNRFNE